MMTKSPHRSVGQSTSRTQPRKTSVSVAPGMVMHVWLPPFALAEFLRSSASVKEAASHKNADGIRKTGPSFFT